MGSKAKFLVDYEALPGVSLARSITGQCAGYLL